MSKHQDLSPLLDYFDMLKTYEQKGYLEVMPDKHEAYITRAAFYTICYADYSDDGIQQLADSSHVAVQQRMKSVSDFVLYIRAYAGWRSQQGKAFMDKPFALHVVTENHPHDLLYTLLASHERVWWKLWLGKTDRVEVIAYADNNASK